MSRFDGDEEGDMSASTMLTAGKPADTFRAHDNRRREVRTRCSRTVQILACAGSDRFLPAELSDCSPHGLGMFSSCALAAGSQFLTRVNLDEPTLLIYTVQYCCQMQESQYRVGARFTGYAATEFRREPRAIVQALAGVR
jgi:hypothetical protein